MSNQLLREILDQLKTAKQERNDLKSQMNNRFNNLDTKLVIIEEELTNIKTSIKRIEKTNCKI